MAGSDILYIRMQNTKRIRLFDRSVPKQVVREAIVIFFLALSWVFVFTMILTYLSGGGAQGRAFIKSLFEVTSAFGTVGLSAGTTSGLSTLSKLCITLTMFVGRLGPLTLALAVAFRERTDKYIFPEENIMVG